MPNPEASSLVPAASSMTTGVVKSVEVSGEAGTAASWPSERRDAEMLLLEASVNTMLMALQSSTAER
ncbi:MAG: hypothetical protein LKI58_04345 [Actinomyces sp.]|jgi:hypothetical protein|nr:hypothetical protein [Actinomyces sp.]MCI1641836.1 hypothetical protein [Actinomyces sp.]MCI1662015.1 hypothetical protein [Actinomyces sp.]MCI1690785.1 hypothetical protein [Actinomyces sp.]MCI1787283.1 hypothetical protein [Actinomyces sp.]MCI1829677.1 hypothetical protein [Actinomyces sp.]